MSPTRLNARPAISRQADLLNRRRVGEREGHAHGRANRCAVAGELHGAVHSQVHVVPTHDDRADTGDAHTVPVVAAEDTNRGTP